jgi:Polyphosphate kinase 2 (PPK2)
MRIDVFAQTAIDHAPWTVFKSNDKKRPQLEAMRHVLPRIDHADKNPAVVGTPDPLIFGPAREPSLWQRTNRTPRGEPTSPACRPSGRSTRPHGGRGPCGGVPPRKA